MRARGFTRAVVAALSFVLLVTPYALADSLQIDGDNLAPVANQDLAFGTVCLGQTTTKGVLFVIAKNGSTHFANGAAVTVAPTSVPGGFSASSETITMPATWTSLPNGQGTETSPASLSVTFLASSLGAISVNIGYNASGPKAGGGTNSESHNLTVTANVATCDSTPPVLSLPSDMTVEATS